MNRPTPWPIARRQICESTRIAPDITIRKATLGGTRRHIIPAQLQAAPLVTKEISFKEAIRLAAACKESLHTIEQNRGLVIPLSSTRIQVDRTPGSRRRVYRLHGPESEIQTLCA